MKFLQNLTEVIINKYGDKISEICFVLPNRRAGLFLKKYIADKINKTIWSPAVFSIEDFVCDITGLSVADQTTLLFELYRVYIDVENHEPQTFDEFMTWGQILLNDYNDCDINLADTEGVFQYLNEAKAINLWNPENTPLTEYQKKYLEFYNSLSKYYKTFRKYLFEKNIAYQGLIYKTAVEKIEEYLKEGTYYKIIFAGFSALTASEEKIIKLLINEEKAEIYWDADKYYIDNEMQEAGMFLRKYRETWNLKEFNFIGDYFKEEHKNIIITGVPLKMGQTYIAGSLLSKMNNENANSENTALILADENLLIPMLYSIPDNVKDINITMGYNISNSPVHSLFINIFNLFENSKKYSSEKSIRFYSKDIIDFFSHPYIRMIANAGNNKATIENFLSTIKDKCRVFFTNDELLQQIKDIQIYQFFKTDINTPVDLINLFIALINTIRDTIISNKKVRNDNNRFDIEYLFQYAVLLTKIKALQNKYNFIIDLKAFRKIFINLVQTTNVPFIGEPLKGLQIMGMLETRTLDFENIILLSANEGVLPSGKFHNTFIPFDIRKDVGLNTYRQKESIFAYHFYRILQRAKNINIIYNTQLADFGSGEKSRFITQIIEELPRYNSKINVSHEIINTEFSNEQLIQPVCIDKTPAISATLLKLAIKGISPSAINDYIGCKLKFYFKHIEEIDERKKNLETIDAATLGNVVHYALKTLYTPLLNKKIVHDDFKQMFVKAEILINEGFEKYYPNGDIKSGKNLLIFKIANKFLNNFLKQESSLVRRLDVNKKSLVITAIEECFEKDVSCKTKDNELINFKIKGNIDRIDCIDNTVRIIDYKTGVVNNDELKFNSWEQLINESKYAKIFQLLTYAYLYNSTDSEGNIRAGIISFRNLSKGFNTINCPGSTNDLITKSVILKFEEILTEIISSLFNPDISFIQTDDVEICRYCPYKDICNR